MPLLCLCLPLALLGLAGWLFHQIHIRATLASIASQNAHHQTE
jgi:hypothetical protein